MGLFFLKEDTAVDTKLGPFVDKGNGVDYEVGMSAAMDNAATGVRLSKNGGAFADRAEGTAPAYDAFGYYLVKLDATDTNTPGRLKVIFGDAAVCLPCEANFQILHANVFDSLFGAAAADLLDVNVTHVADTAQTGNDNGADINAILTDTGTTLDTLIKDIPTTAEFVLRTLLAADYVVVGDTIAGVTAITNDVGITQAAADKVWDTVARVLTAGTNLNDISAADVKTAIEADGGDLSSLMEALVNKAIWRESDGRLEMHNDSDVSQGTIAAQITTDGTYTNRERAYIAPP